MKEERAKGSEVKNEKMSYHVKDEDEEEDTMMMM